MLSYHPKVKPQLNDLKRIKYDSSYISNYSKFLFCFLNSKGIPDNEQLVIYRKGLYSLNKAIAQKLNHEILQVFSNKFPGGKARPGRNADYSPPSSAEVVNE
jgi:hypothetical protein